ncbi:MAG: cadherin-like beta sandwich domain-containing protein [Spirochaetes bacterium]|nr:cadherin-like beta sandwich domain-containing protein [Spirochaetota bacterium]
MKKAGKILGLFLTITSIVFINSCWNGETGALFIPNMSYSGQISNADLELLEVITHEGTTGTTTTVALTPAFDPATSTYNVAIEALVTDVTVVAVADDRDSVVQIDTSECSSRTITVSEDSREIEIIVTAPDSVTQKAYTILLTRTYGMDENRLLNCEVFSDTNAAIDPSPQFEPDTNTYQLRVAWNSYYIKVKPTLISGYSSLKLDGSTIPSGEKELIILDDLAIGNTSDTQDVEITVKSSTGVENTYTITVSRLAPAAVTGDNPYLSSIRVTMGNNDSVRQIYQDQDGNFFPDNSDAFNKNVGGYSCVVFGYNTVTVTLEPYDPDISSLVVNGTEQLGDMVSGKLTVEQAWATGDYSIKTITIHVVSNDTNETMDYTLRLRLLNVYEVYFGIYGPVSRRNKSSWGAAGMPNWTKVFNGSISGQMEWKITWVQTLSTARNQMTYTNYNNGDWDQPFVGDNGGFALNGMMSVIVNTSGTGQGPQTGDIPMTTPEGDLIALMHVNLKIVNKDAVGNDSASYTEVDYLDQTGVRLYYQANPSLMDNLGPDYWDPNVPWTADDFWHP